MTSRKRIGGIILGVSIALAGAALALLEGEKGQPSSQGYQQFQGSEEQAIRPGGERLSLRELAEAARQAQRSELGQSEQQVQQQGQFQSGQAQASQQQGQFQSGQAQVSQQGQFQSGQAQASQQQGQFQSGQAQPGQRSQFGQGLVQSGQESSKSQPGRFGQLQPIPSGVPQTANIQAYLPEGGIQAPVPHYWLADSSLFTSVASDTAAVLIRESALFVQEPGILGSQAQFLTNAIARSLSSLDALEENSRSTNPGALPNIRAAIGSLLAAKAEADILVETASSGVLGPSFRVNSLGIYQHLRIAQEQLRVVGRQYKAATLTILSERHSGPGA